MAAVTQEQLAKVEMTPSQQKLFACLLNIDRQTGKPGPRPTIEQVTKAYSKMMGHTLKEGSVTTACSQLRKQFKLQGIEYPPMWDIKSEGGGGRKAVRTSAVSALNDVLGSNFDISSLTAITVGDSDSDEGEANEDNN